MEQAKFIAYLDLMNALVERGVLQTDRKYPKNVITYRTGLDVNEYGTTEGWVSEPISDVAQRIFENQQTRINLHIYLAGIGIKPIYENREFVRLDICENSPYAVKSTKNVPLREKNQKEKTA